MDFTGYLTINGTDLWTSYGAFLGETTAGGHVNMDALMRVPKAKDITTVDFRERNGVELPENPDLKLSSIERTLQFWLRGDSVPDRIRKYRNMMEALTSGRISMTVKDYGTYNLIYQDMPSAPEWYTDIRGDKFYAFIQVKFLDPEPTLTGI